jgi:protein-S-isoprenylcysteine O-methyltransferase Ste14
MTIYNRLIAAFWLILVVYWAATAIGAKKTIGARVWSREVGLRVGVLVLILLALRLPVFRQVMRNALTYAAGANALMGVVGVVLCALGIGLAIWARAYLGRNWGMPMSRKESPELVTSGPYAYVRHPIYTGLLIAMLGSAIGASPSWSIPLVLFGVYFVYSARKEETLMIEQFPEQYPAYMKRTKMLVPFVL